MKHQLQTTHSAIKQPNRIPHSITLPSGKQIQENRFLEIPHAVTSHQTRSTWFPPPVESGTDFRLERWNGRLVEDYWVGGSSGSVPFPLLIKSQKRTYGWTSWSLSAGKAPKTKKKEIPRVHFPLVSEWFGMKLSGSVGSLLDVDLLDLDLHGVILSEGLSGFPFRWFPGWRRALMGKVKKGSDSHPLFNTNCQAHSSSLKLNAQRRLFRTDRPQHHHPSTTFPSTLLRLYTFTFTLADWTTLAHGTHLSPFTTFTNGYKWETFIPSLLILDSFHEFIKTPLIVFNLLYINLI